MQITLSFDNFTELPYTSGTVQNISSQATVEICQDDTANTGLILGPGEWFSWSNSTVYARSAWDYEPTAICAVVPFKKGGEGGGSEYILPVATKNTLGGVKSSDEAGAIKVDALGKMTYNAPSSTPLSAPDWETNTAYPENALVEYNDNIYICITAHTSGTFADDLANGKWKLVSMTLNAATSSELGGVKSNSADGGVTVASDGKMTINLPKATSSTLGGVKIGGGLSVTADGTLSATSTGGGISIWQANTSYNVNDVVIDSNLIWQCATAHTSTTTFDESKWICISGGEISNGMEIVTLYEGEFSFDNSTQGPWPTSSTPMMELSESIDNFEHIYVTTCTDSRNNHVSTIVPVSSFNNDKSIRVDMYENTSQSYNIEIVKYDSLHLAIIYKTMAGWTSGYVKSVRGIRKAKPIVSSGMKYETLYTSSTTLSDEDFIINLAEPIGKYKKIGFTVLFDVGDTEQLQYFEVSSSSLIEYTNNTLQWGYINTTQRIGNLQASSANIIEGHCYGTHCITKIIGISEGVQIPTGVQAARVTLFEGRVTSTATLLDSYTNYDELEFVIAFDVGYDSIKQYTVATDVIKSTANTSNVILFPWGYSDNGKYLELQPISSNTQFNFGGSQAYLTKIVGIKYIQPDSYSTEEKLIGTWVDGKPLYRKVFTFESMSGTSYSFAHEIVGANFKNIYGKFIYPNSNGNATLTIPCYYDSSSYSSAFATNNIVNITKGSSYSYVTDVEIILEYTKN